jgi:hypothetical protein
MPLSLPEPAEIHPNAITTAQRPLSFSFDFKYRVLYPAWKVTLQYRVSNG